MSALWKKGVWHSRPCEKKKGSKLKGNLKGSYIWKVKISTFDIVKIWLTLGMDQWCDECYFFFILIDFYYEILIWLYNYWICAYSDKKNLVMNWSFKPVLPVPVQNGIWNMFDKFWLWLYIDRYSYAYLFINCFIASIACVFWQDMAWRFAQN